MDNFIKLNIFSLERLQYIVYNLKAYLLWFVLLDL